MSVFRAIYHCRRPRAGIIKLLRTMGRGKRLNETKRNALFALQPKKRLRGDNVIHKQIAIMLRDAFMSWLTEAFVFVNSSVAVRPYQLMCTSCGDFVSREGRLDGCTSLIAQTKNSSCIHFLTLFSTA